MIDFSSAPSSSNKGNRSRSPFRGGFSLQDIPEDSGSESPAKPREFDPGSSELPSYILNLNDRQREAALATEGPLIVLAGAGSGKTKMLTSRIALLMDACRVPGHQILAVTFTNKAAGEMKERVEKMLPHGSGLYQPEIGTFHSVCVRILRKEMASTPFTSQFTIYDDSDQLSLIKSVVAKLGIDEKSFSPKALQAGINRAKCDAIEPQDMQPSAHNIFDRQLKRVYEQYQKDLFACNALDFGEIICMVYRIFRDFPEVRAKYQRRFRYIHVDEYQDTNRAQYLLLSMLAQARYGGHQNICVVGDEDQSIYKWRGADIRNILDFESDYPGARIVKLEQNYRSTKCIITAASQVIRNNKERKDKTLWTDNEEGLPLVRVQLPDERAEAEMVVGEIKRLAENEERSYGDFAIFYRTHAQSRQFEDVFRREKIAYQIVGGLRFYDRKEIKDVLSYFKVILNPSDSVGLKRIINVPARGIGKTTLDKLDSLHSQLQADQARGGGAQGELHGGETADTSYWGALKLAARDSSITSAGTAKKIGQFVTLIERLRVEQPKLLLSELYHLILDETGYVRELRQEGTEESMARIENLEEFDTLLQEFEEDVFENVPEAERDARKTELLALFIEQSTLVSEADQQETLGSAVKMMTLHSSKGLEFPVVFLPGMEEGLFPSVKPWEETPDEDVEEERRLCYVGMTRAREQLFMSHVVVRRLWGNVNYQEPARFFAEMPGDLVEFKDLSHGGGASRFRPGSSRQYGSGDSSSYGSSGGSPTSYGKYGSSTYGSSSKSSEPSEGRRIVVDEYSHVSQDSDIVGHRINHPEYGLGTVIGADGSGQDMKITVEFKNRDRRKFLLRYVRAMIEV